MAIIKITPFIFLVNPESNLFVIPTRMLQIFGILLTAEKGVCLILIVVHEILYNLKRLLFISFYIEIYFCSHLMFRVKIHLPITCIGVVRGTAMATSNNDPVTDFFLHII